MTHKFTLCFLMAVSLFFSACTKINDIASQKDNPAQIKNRCINDVFEQNADTGLYGKKCIDGKRLVIKTSSEGVLVKTSGAKNLSSEVEFINKVYRLKYEIVKDKGDDSEDASYLNDLIPSGETAKKFFGSEDKEYDILFKITGNYLTLYKVSKNLADIPYTERTSMEKTEADEYMVPFLGYPIRYCNAQIRINHQGESTRENFANCDTGSTNTKYIRIENSANANTFKFESKQDLLPANYFDGQWFVTHGEVESSEIRNHTAPISADLIEFKKFAKHLEGKNASGKLEDRNRKTLILLPIQWIDYELSKNGTNFERFGEKENIEKDFAEKKYALIKFIGEKITIPPTDPLTNNKPIETLDMQDLLVTENYFSFLVTTNSVKYRFSFLKKSAVVDKDFFQRRLFRKDHDQYFGTLSVMPPIIQKMGENTKDDVEKHARMIYFNANKKDNIIKWYFSKNSPKEDHYRDIAREAVKIWNQAFQIITKDSDKKIKLELVEDEDKDLGDLRYNIINLIHSKDIQGSQRAIGFAPSYMNSDTGQIIATTSNIYMHSTEEIITTKIKNYIRNQVFQKEDNPNIKDKDFEVIGPYIKSQITKYCATEIENIIKIKREQREEGNLKPSDALKDTKLAVTCAKKIARKSILATLIHEMGHSFGLGHNFKASRDIKNYYKDQAEVKKNFPDISFGSDLHGEKISKTSSVMDYTPSNQPKLTYPGKYDLAALRFLYRSQVETQSGEFLNLTLPAKPDEQTEMTVTNIKPYLHCSDNVVEQKSDLSCLRHDYGSTLEDVFQSKIDLLLRLFNAKRYRYGKKGLETFPLGVFLSTAYNHFWLPLRDKSFKSDMELTKYSLLNGEESSSKYLTALKEKQDDRGKDSNYTLLSKSRKLVPKFFEDFVFQTSMRCQVSNKKEEQHVINFELIRDQLLRDAEADSHASNFYAENCYSKDVQQLLNSHGLEVKGQSGIEGFLTTSYTRHTIDSSNSFNVLPVFLWKSDLIKIAPWVEEPDKAHEVMIKLKKDLLTPPEGHSPTDFIILQNIYMAFTTQLLSSQKEVAFKDQLTENQNYLRDQKFEMEGTGTESFYQLVTVPLQNGKLLDSPFLVKAYEDFQSKVAKTDYKYKTFRNYLLNEKKSELYITQKVLLVPWTTNGFPAQVYKKFNENNTEIKKLKALEEPTFLDTIKLTNLEAHNQILLATRVMGLN